MSGTVDPVVSPGAGAPGTPPEQVEALVSAPVPASPPVEGVAAEPKTPDQSAPESPVEAAAPAEPTSTEPEQPAFKPHTETPSLIADAGKQPDAPAVEPTAPAAPVYEFTLPEGVTVAPEQMGAYTGVLSKFGVAPEAGQELINMHTAEMQRYAESTLARQHEAFAETRKGWADKVRNDPEIGGANFDKTMDNVAWLRDNFVPRDGKVRDELNDYLNSTGGGDHPGLIRWLNRVAAAMREPAAPSPAQQPPSDVGRRPARPNGVRAISPREFYDHPSSEAYRQ